MDMDEVLREDMAKGDKYGEKKKGKKIRKYKNAKPVGSHVCNHNFAFIQFRYTWGL